MEYAIGIDLGGTSIKYALVDKAGNSFFEGKLPSFASVSAAKVIEQLIKAVMLLKDEAAKQNWTVLGIGLGTPGIVDETNRIVLGGAENIIGWENIDVASLLEEQMKLPVVVGNDANLMGLGEAKYGAGRGCTHVVFLTVGTGIGGAVIDQQHLQPGNILGKDGLHGSPQGGCRIVDGHDHTDTRRHNVLHSFQNSFFHFGVKPVIGQGQRGQAL